VFPRAATYWKATVYGGLLSLPLLGASAGAVYKPSQIRDGAEAPPRHDSASGWSVELSSEELTIYSRLRDGTAVKEFKGAGLTDASPGAVFAVLDGSGGALPTFVAKNGSRIAIP
jgi:hypothetical protein